MLYQAMAKSQYCPHSHCLKGSALPSPFGEGSGVRCKTLSPFGEKSRVRYIERPGRRYVFRYLLFGIVVVAFFSCSASRQVRYLQTTETKKVIDLQSSAAKNTVRFQPDDVLAISINAKGKAAALIADFNLPLQPSATTYEAGSESIDHGVGRQTYWVSKDGYIDFPVLGHVKVTGYTQKELEGYFKELLRNYLKEDPIVTVRLMNFRITVIGEVNRPGEYTINRDHINIMEALALAGDMTIYGKRTDVKIIRIQPDGKTQIATIDVSKAEVVASPYFYLHQNDQIYVVPNNAKTISADIGSVSGLIFSSVSILLSVINTVLVIRSYNR
ncbi:MAG: polysaccharide biosynthesis/export family protein [Dysgonamonadaceae bacterium]|nr:polysaccharide biosynthesis/export family protein [Dysgonamonadaceae bacterium]